MTSCPIFKCHPDSANISLAMLIPDLSFCHLLPGWKMISLIHSRLSQFIFLMVSLSLVVCFQLLFNVTFLRQRKDFTCAQGPASLLTDFLFPSHPSPPATGPKGYARAGSREVQPGIFPSHSLTAPTHSWWTVAKCTVNPGTYQGYLNRKWAEGSHHWASGCSWHCSPWTECHCWVVPWDTLECAHLSLALSTPYPGPACPAGGKEKRPQEADGACTEPPF